MDSVARKATAFFEVCLGSLSCMKWHTGMTSHRNGNRVCLKTSMYWSASMDPSNVHMPVAPFKLMPAHTWTFTGCLAQQEKECTVISIHQHVTVGIQKYHLVITILHLGLFLGSSSLFLQHNLLCVSSWTERSSVHSTSWKPPSASCWYCSAQCKRSSLLASRMCCHEMFIPGRFCSVRLFSLRDCSHGS